MITLFMGYFLKKQNITAAILLFLTTPLFAAHTTFSYHGRVFDEIQKLAITGTADFSLTVTTENQACVLYAEKQEQIALSEYGVFSLEVGSAQFANSPNVQRSPSDIGINLNHAFSFISASQTAAACTDTITPSNRRFLNVTILSGEKEIQLDPQPILISPLASLAFSLNGHDENDFIQINNIVTQAAIERLITLGPIPGPKGDKGATGAQGPRGVAGAKGNTGAQGAPGLTGAKGNTGAQGVRGLTGAQGPRGLTTGTPGAQGATGAQGVRGLTGTQGVRGTQGPRGLAGAKGAAGARGTQGVRGLTGKGNPGAQGIRGLAGAKGNAGARGPRGLAGKNANPNNDNCTTLPAGTTTALRAPYAEGSLVTDAVNNHLCINSKWTPFARALPVTQVPSGGNLPPASGCGMLVAEDGVWVYRRGSCK